MNSFKEDPLFPSKKKYLLPNLLRNPWQQRRSYQTGVVCELDGNFVNHYFHDMEWILGVYAWSKYRFHDQSIESVVCSRKNNSSIVDKLLKIIFPKADFIQQGRFSHKVNGKLGHTTVIENAVTTDRLESIKRKTPFINKMLDESIDVARKYFPDFLTAVYQGLSILPKSAPKKREDVVVTYVMRKPQRYLEKRDELFRILREEFQVQVNTVYFENMSFEEQVQTVATTDILIGVHGNGLTNLLWLPEHGATIELIPKESHQYDYQVFSEVTDRYYVGFNCDDPEFLKYYKGTRHKDYYGAPDATLKDLDFEVFKSEFSLILTDHLEFH